MNFENCKENILSSLKAMKGRLFGTRQKPQSESEKNLQSIAREENHSIQSNSQKIKARNHLAKALRPTQ